MHLAFQNVKGNTPSGALRFLTSFTCSFERKIHTISKQEGRHIVTRLQALLAEQSRRTQAKRIIKGRNDKLHSRIVISG
jgi:hypothetical protein